MADIPRNILNHIAGLWIQGDKVVADDDVADGDIPNGGQFVVYFDDSAGKLKFKARNAAGTVVEETITSS